MNLTVDLPTVIKTDPDLDDEGLLIQKSKPFEYQYDDEQSLQFSESQSYQDYISHEALHK